MIKGAFGVFHQNLRLSSIPNFSFFDTWLPTDKSLPVSSADHFIISLETRPWEGYILNIDAYYKIMHNVNEMRNTSYEGSEVKDVFFTGEGRSWGMEIFMQRKIGNFTGWVGYAIRIYYFQV